MNIKKKTKVLIIDDSSLVREILCEILEKDDQIAVCGSVANPYEAAEVIQQEVPDVITLDLVMPRMDGITFLKKLMKQHPIPTIVISSYTSENVQLALQAYEAGAIYVLHKPTVETKSHYEEYSGQICALVRAAGKTKEVRNIQHSYKETFTKESSRFSLKPYSDIITAVPKIIAIGASAGGTVAIQSILKKITSTPPCIVITQHMPPVFTKEFAKGLDRVSRLSVTEAAGGEELLPGKVFIAPGDQHLVVTKKEGQFFTKLQQRGLVNYHRPSVDILFESVAQNFGPRSMAIILSGMGRDGVKGMMEIKKNGGVTLAQNKESSMVYGMPGEAMRTQAAMTDIPLDLIPFLFDTINHI